MTGAALRVLAVSDFYLPRHGGVERVIQESAAALGSLGIAVEVLTRRLEPGAAGEEPCQGIPVWRLGRGPAPLPLELLRLGREGRAWARRHLRRFDVVHAHLTLTALPLLGPVGRRKIPLVATFYGPWDREYREELQDPARPSRWPAGLRRLAVPLVARLLRAAQGRLLGAAARVVALSRHSVGELGALGYNDLTAIEVIPAGVNGERFRPREVREARRRLGIEGFGAPLLVSVRRLVPRMGLETLFESLGALVEAHPRVGLVVAGTGPLEGKLERRRSELGLGSRIRLLGEVREEDLPWLYAAADLVVVPTRALEGFGLPVLEGWASGAPVVATPVGALPETAGLLDPGLVARDRSPGALAAAIRYGLEGLGDGRLRERARELALGFSWERASLGLARLYRSVAARGDVP